MVSVQDMSERLLGTSHRVRRAFHACRNLPVPNEQNSFLLSSPLSNLMFSQPTLRCGWRAPRTTENMVAVKANSRGTAESSAIEFLMYSSWVIFSTILWVALNSCDYKNSSLIYLLIYLLSFIFSKDSFLLFFFFASLGVLVLLTFILCDQFLDS